MTIYVIVIFYTTPTKGLKMTLQQILKQHSITSVWHFTDLSNLNSIKEYGIASLEMIEKQKIEVSRFGADELSHKLDKRYGLDGYVHLAFTDDHPMYHIAKNRGTIKRGIWLEIPVSEILKDDVLFCDAVANKNHATLYNKHEIANNIDFETLLYGTDFESRKNARKAEILIPGRINFNKVIGGHYGK